VLERRHAGRRTDAKAAAKELGVSVRSVFRYRRDIQRAGIPLPGAKPCPSLRTPQGRRQAKESAAIAQRPYYRRLVHCAKLLDLESSGYRGDADDLAKLLAVDKRTLFRDLALIEAATGRALKLLPRRKKPTKS
jgi:predicted DNA-binding transcriptional regulator YafY